MFTGREPLGLPSSLRTPVQKTQGFPRLGQLTASRDCPVYVFKKCVFFPHVQGRHCEGMFKYSGTKTPLSFCSPHSVYKGFGPSVRTKTKNTQNTKKYESNEFVSERSPLSAKRSHLIAGSGNLSEPMYAAPSVSTRWRHGITNKPARSTQLRSGPGGGARRSRSGFANRFSSRVGDAYSNARLQTAICKKKLRISMDVMCASHILKEEISSLLNKGAIPVVPPNLMNQGFYSRYFLVPKKGCSFRPILNLRVLNKHMRKYISEC